VVAAVGMVPTITTEDWMLGGTNGALWVLLLAGEAGVALTAGLTDHSVSEPAEPPVPSLHPGG
jgi:hypothetical protein